MEYQEFLESKIKVAERRGIHVDRALLHPSLRDDQKDIALWALELGGALVAPDAGMGKTRIGIEVMRMLQREFGGKCLIVTELGAAETFVDPDPEVGEAAAMGMRMDYVTKQAEAFTSPCDIIVTNYERIRDGNFDFGAFTAVWLDEGNYVKNMASETTEAIKTQLAKVRFKYIATATPSPNETLELINYSHVLGICDRGQILTRFFQRNSVKAGELTLHPHHVDDFWLWVHSWCSAITSPSDLGYNFPGFELPKLNLNWIEVPYEKTVDPGADRDGQGRLYIESRSGLSEAAKIKRDSISARIAEISRISDKHPGEHFIFWHHLEDERKALNKTFGHVQHYGDIYGSQDWTVREQRIVDFTKGKLWKLATKPEISGVGCNFQKHCYNSIFVGINDSFNDIYQAIKRIWRFYSPFEEVNIWLLYTPEEYDIVLNLQRKWREHNEMRDQMRVIIQKYGLDHSKYIAEKRRSFKVDRKVFSGESFTLANNDCVLELDYVASDSVDMILSSFPFGNHYEYTDKYNDFGHNQTNADFIRQMDYLIPKLYNRLKPGRICAVHLKNRIHYGSVTGLGFSILHRFSHLVCEAMERNGFYTIGNHYVPTDVVAENNQTYRLGYGEMKKDATKMGAGIPEEIWIFRKPPTSNANAYADEPVKHDESYTLSHWQVDADSFWKSSGNRYLTPHEMKAWGLDKIQAWWKRFNKETVYDYDAHVALLQDLDDHNKLSRTFTTLPLQANCDQVMNDINRMHGLNMEQARRKQQNHICPMPFDEVDRLIELYSNPGELILDPFGGLGTTGVRALKKGRRAYIIELNDAYAKCAHTYLKETEMRRAIPTLFDMITA
jgi:DNA modification methylase